MYIYIYTYIHIHTYTVSSSIAIVIVIVIHSVVITSETRRGLLTEEHAVRDVTTELLCSAWF